MRQRTRSQAAGTARAKKAKVALSPRDRAILAWIGRQRMAEVRQLAAMEWPVGEFGARSLSEEPGTLAEETIRQRCKELAAAGYLEGRRWLYGRPGVLQATASGLREGGIDLPPARVDTRTYVHDLTCVWVCIELEREFPDGRVLTEREVRAADAGVFEPSYSPGLLGRSGAVQRIHVPDLAVEPEPGAEAIAIEIELSPKSGARLRQIMRLYARARHLGGVRYYAEGEATIRGVVRAAAAEEVNEFDSGFLTLADLPPSAR